jgi:hypothetical protein
MGDLYDELEFPLRAEYLGQYKNYQVDVTHWRELAIRLSLPVLRLGVGVAHGSREPNAKVSEELTQ